MTQKFKNIYIEISKLGVFPALSKGEDVYLTTNNMDRVALIYNNSMYCEAVIDEKEYRFNGPMKKEIIPIMKVSKEEQTPLIRKVVKLPNNWVYEQITGEEYLKKYREKNKSYDQMYNEQLDRLIKELFILQQSTPRLSQHEGIGVEEVQEVKRDIEMVVKEIKKIKL